MKDGNKHMIDIINSTLSKINVTWNHDGNKSYAYDLEKNYGITVPITNTINDEAIEHYLDSIKLNGVRMFDNHCKIVAGIEWTNGTMSKYKQSVLRIQPSIH